MMAEAAVEKAAGYCHWEESSQSVPPAIQVDKEVDRDHFRGKDQPGEYTYFSPIFPSVEAALCH